MQGADLQFVNSIVSKITFLPGWHLLISRDKKSSDGRIYLQWRYSADCTVTGENQEWGGRKWYLSSHMTEGEIVKTAFAAALAALEHEVRENFQYKNCSLFNPHIDIHALMSAAQHHATRASPGAEKTL